MAPGGEEAIKFEAIEHTADWALRVFGRDLSHLLENAALGMAHLMVGDLSTVPLNEERTLELNAFDAETLLVDWLTELAYWAEDEQLVFCKFKLSKITENHLSAVIRGGQAAELQNHIKAVTYHDLKSMNTDQGLVTTILFDV
jgi:SHS2 domain-containing protein